MTGFLHPYFPLILWAMFTNRFLIIAWMAAIAGAAGCDRKPPGRTLDVFAAASLTGSFMDLGKQFEAGHPGVSVRFNFAGSQQLRAQLENGAAADIFASANRKEMDAAVRSGLIDGATVRNFAHNRLIVIFPKNPQAPIRSIGELAGKGVRIDVADPSVPVGKYTQEMIDRMAADSRFGPGFKKRFLANVVSREENVKSVVNKVRLGEVDAGITYASDAADNAATDLTTLPVPPEFNPTADYPIGRLRQAKSPELGMEFEDLVLSEAGQGVIRKHGLLGK